MPKLPRLLAALLLLLTAACASVPPEDLPRPAPTDVAALAQAITDLGAGVDPEEARRMAQISYDYPLSLAVAYRIEDSPIIHNMKVNQGLKPRGLCYQWADDLETRLSAERFRTLELHRAIANSDSAIRIEHSTVIVSAPGDSMYDGIVLDPWRNGGQLYWEAVRDDTRYPWLPREEVFKRKRARAHLNGPG
ncbi:hypothetical protein AL036_06965 [Salipiger aestuarii]|uniref:Lipoprotein n=1 Tax=Salipiger aestuarii TaxID=568098 RepID=A0A327YPS2_9RHOB|nr:hypothetical protein [Salipiger aestuarii]EIE52198.1 putative lipoprotein [Citreicella sp. 357]KAA8608400.1 hypothetical protein AL036_06965 [Salipiger aestuarii]KAA8612323.1 hypothetical protein AL037_07810 [Salipiger aestuarii]KAB2541456.1 hypothetical protein AL035_12485 [Salipiger aestuarii]RAK20109.1 hypothetical protein ATI53_1007111 [Salipiger aestuarii]